MGVAVAIPCHLDFSVVFAKKLTCVSTAVSAAVAAAMLTGCGFTQVSGGGWIPSVVEGEKANFGFWGDSCYEGVQGNFNYHDMNAVEGGVKMNGWVTEAADCAVVDGNLDAKPLCLVCKAIAGEAGLRVAEDGSGLAALAADYRSTNPKIKGEGKLIACMADNGEGSKAIADDMIAVKVTKGPFKGYFNKGYVQGNIQQWSCPES